MSVRPLSDVRAIAATAVGLLLVSLVALASGGSPWHAGGRQDVPVGLVRALAAAAGALFVGSLLLVWAGTPSVEKRRRQRRRLGARDLEGLGASLSAAGKAAAIVGGAIGLLLLLTLPFLAPTAPTLHGGTTGNAAPRRHVSTRAPAGHATSAALTWLVVGSAAALLLVAPAAVVVRRRRARRARRALVPDAAARVGSDLRRSLADLESERDPRLAVERAYARMEESLGVIELSRALDETPSEFTARVLRVLGVSAAAASDLTGLFEIARFSDHPMDEDDRRRAIASVRRVEAGGGAAVTARRPLFVVTAGCVAATGLGLVFGQGSTVALGSALALAAALAGAAALQLRPARRRQPPPRARDDEMPPRLRQIADDLRGSERSEFDVDRSLRPLLVPIVTARLGRRGVDMARAPRRAQELLGDVLWEIVRPDRPSASYRVGHGLAGDDLRTAIERLEQL